MAPVAVVAGAVTTSITTTATYEELQWRYYIAMKYQFIRSFVRSFVRTLVRSFVRSFILGAKTRQALSYHSVSIFCPR